jgi:sulfur carrier protein
MNDTTITVQLNGNRCQLAAHTLLHEALGQWQQQGQVGPKVATAINGEFVPRSQYHTTRLTDGDLIDIVQPVGGG